MTTHVTSTTELDEPEPVTISLPASCLVVLVGVSGSGKSTFAKRHFGPFETISSDFCRGLVSNDENDQAASARAFDVLNYIVTKRLEQNLLTVVDATNVQRGARTELVALARAHDMLPVAIVLDVPEKVAIARNSTRPDREFGAHVVTRQRTALRSSLKSLNREGFRGVHVLRGAEQIDAAHVTRHPLLPDRRAEAGPFDVIGDVHGCLAELRALLDKLGYTIRFDESGRPVDAEHPEGRRAVFLGDLVDRGPDSVGVLRLVMGMVQAGHALAVPGNHENKLVRALGGRTVQHTHGLDGTLEQLDKESPQFREEVRTFCHDLVSHLVFDGGKLVVAHAGLKEEYQLRASGRVRSFALYGDVNGEVDEFGLPVRYPWANDYRGKAMVLYGHINTPDVQWVNNTMCLDTGCVFGGKLTAMRYPEREIVQVPAAKAYFESERPAPASGNVPAPEAVPEGAALTQSVAVAGASDPAPGLDNRQEGLAAGREPGVLALADVTGHRFVETRRGGRITISAESAAGALEVMSRFAVDPRLLAYLPPTMCPVATSREPGYLEHPDDAFAAYAAQGVEQVICEEKHMGSRAVILVARDSAGSGSGIIEHRFDIGAPGIIHTRTGRAFFPGPTSALALERIAAACEKAGIWEELGADWLLFDAEVLPWSLKAGQLIRDQYASVGAAGRAVMPAALAALTAAQARGLDIGELATRLESRAANARAFTEAYRHYCWPAGADASGLAAGDPLTGVQIAPFQILASGRTDRVGPDGRGTGTTYETRDHAWHMSVGDRLAAVDALFRPTRRLVVDTTSGSSRATGVTWWLDLTAVGGEGMVVKPASNLTYAPRKPGKDRRPSENDQPSGNKGPADNGHPGRLVQPGLKVRGREYLRIIYGPDYTEPQNLERLRNRALGRKSSLAIREYSLGLEALSRVADGEPLWRVHEPVFAVLALESEPVDPRL